MVYSVTLEQYHLFAQNYEKGMYPHLRFGQAFVGTQLNGVIDPELFYTENRSIAENIIFSKYVVFN